SIRTGGDEMDEAIIKYMNRQYNLLIGKNTAENIKISVGSAYKLDEELSIEVKGRDQISGLPKTLNVRSEEVREALIQPVNTILEVVRTSLERCPPELSADLVDRGIVLAGGGALMKGIDKLLAEETGLPIHVADDPLSAVALGTGKVLDEIKILEKIGVRRRRGV
ncbi:MAG: rod shape-determining protein, partial [Candidatus Aureabacteria bacterium]|nr:rod shape-determining protein [Candidatus Auribacterota bacterium]